MENGEQIDRGHNTLLYWLILTRAQRLTECASAANAPMKGGGVAATEIIRARQQQALVRRHTRIRLGPLSRCRRKRPFAVN